jgi:hypothetical protein
MSDIGREQSALTSEEVFHQNRTDHMITYDHIEAFY